MSFSQLKAVAFDLDGTLVNSGPDLALSINLMLKDLGRKPFPDTTVQGWVGNGMEVLVRRALSGSETIDPNIDETRYLDARARFDAIYREHLCVNTRPYPTVVATLKWLSERQIPLAVVTNKPYDFTIALLEQLDMRKFFDVVLGGDSLDKKKPDPYPLQYVLDQWQLNADQMLMVGDSRNDILAAQAAGTPSLGMTYGYNYGLPIADSNPTWVADELQYIQTILTPA